MKNFLSLPRNGSGEWSPIKRESGESPEQSRCCKFRKKKCRKPFFCHWMYSGKAACRQEQVRRPAVCLSVFTAFEEKAWDDKRSPQAASFLFPFTLDAVLVLLTTD